MLNGNEITPEIFYQIKAVIDLQEDLYARQDLIEFLDDLPIRLKIKTVMYVFKDAYSSI
jgi:hypothetical protein